MSSKRRVKVYKLDESGAWRDEGTGFVECRLVEGSLFLTVTSEDNESVTLLNSRVPEEQEYQKQQETLIVWNEPTDDGDQNADLALSFQDAAGCGEVWMHINEFQGKPTRWMHEELDDSDEEYLDEGNFVADLPPPNLKNLDDIISKLHSLSGQEQKDRFSNAVIKENYLKKLIDLFNVIEDVDDRPSLYKMYEIWKSLVMLNVAQLLERIFHPDIILDAFGALEYDPDLARKLNHREFLKSHVVYKEVIPLKPFLIELIHMTFRLQYMKDVALPRVLDEATFAMLNSLIFFNNVKIATELKKDEDFLRKLFAKLKAPTTPVEDTKDLIRFLNEFCELGKNLEMKTKASLYHTLDRHGLFEAIERALGLPGADDKLRMYCVEVLVHTVENDASLLRRAISKQKMKRHPFMVQLIRLFHSNCDTGIKNLLFDVFRMILETEPDQLPEKHEFLTLFYQDFMKMLLEPIFQPLPTGLHQEAESLMKGNLLELLTFCVQQHTFRIRYYLLDHHVIAKVLVLLKCKDKHLILSSLRFFRAVVGANDKNYIKHIIKENLFAPIVELFLENSSRYNMINSAILDLFSYIKSEGVRALLQYFVEKFYDKVQHVTYTDIFHVMKQRQKGEEESPAQTSARTTPNKIARPDDERFSRDIEESAYFESDDDESDSSDASPANSPSKSFHPMSLRSRNSAPALGSSAPKLNLLGDADEDFGPPVSLAGLVAYPEGEDGAAEPNGAQKSGAEAKATASGKGGFDYFSGLPSTDEPKVTTAASPAGKLGARVELDDSSLTPSPNRRKRKSPEIQPGPEDVHNLTTSPSGKYQMKEGAEPPAKRIKEDDPPPAAGLGGLDDGGNGAATGSNASSSSSVSTPPVNK